MKVCLEIHLSEGIFYKDAEVDAQSLWKGTAFLMDGKFPAVVSNYDSKKKLLTLALDPQTNKGKALTHLLLENDWKMVGAEHQCDCHHLHF